MKIPIDSIRLDGDTQSRDGVKQDIVNEYADDMREGAIFPPVVIYDDEADKWLSEGFHRLYAARQAGAQEIEAEVRQGTKRDAQLNSMRSNATHGARRTNADKRRAVEMAFRWLIEEGRSLKSITDTEVAEMACVTIRFVGTIREIVYTNLNGSQVTEVTKSEAKELTVTQRLKEKVDSLEWKLRDAERQKEALEKREKEIAELKEKHRKESEAASKFEGEKIKLENEMEYLQERIKEIEGKNVEYLTPPDVEDELEALRLENSRIAAALEEAKKPQAPVALPEPKIERVEVEVIKEVVPPEIAQKLKQYEDYITETRLREINAVKLEEKKDNLLREIQQLREQANQARSEKGLIDGFDFLQTASSVTEKIVDMAGRGTLTIEQITEAERIFKGMLVAANNGLQAIRDIQGVTKEGGGLRVVR